MPGSSRRSPTSPSGRCRANWISRARCSERVALLEGLDEQRHRALPGRADPTQSRAQRRWSGPCGRRGRETILVSGGFTAFVEPIAEQIGFDRFEANVLGVADGKLTGATEGRIVDARRKHDVLVEARDRLGLSPEETMAIGDGANDMPMVEEAGLGIAYRAKPALAAVADARLDHHGLDALLWAQGIPRARLDRGLARLDREAGLRREPGASRGRGGAAFERSGLQPDHRARRHIIGLPPGELAR